MADKIAVALNYPTKMRFDLAGGKSVVLNGNAEYLRGQEQGHLPKGAFGITMVDSELWEAVQKAYGKMKIFKNGLCFAVSTRAAAEKEADRRSDTKHGREAVSTKTARTKAATATE